MSCDKPPGAVPGVAVVLAVCCGLHALLLLVGGITLVGISLGSWTLAFGGLIVLALAVVRFRRHSNDLAMDPCMTTPPERSTG